MKEIRSFRGWRRFSDPQDKTAVFCKKNRRENLLLFADKAGHRWTLNLTEMEEMIAVAAQERLCPSCKKGTLTGVVNKKIQRSFLACEHCGVSYGISHGRCYRRPNLLVGIASLVGGELGHFV